MLKNTWESWGSVARTFHWGMAVMIGGLLIVGFTMTDMAPSAEKWRLYDIHKAMGVTVLSLVILRFGWRLFQSVPELPKRMPNWQKVSARGTVYLFYAVMFCMPVSGAVMSLFSGHEISYFGLFTIAAVTHGATPLAAFSRTVHVTLAYVLIVTIFLHTVAALYHHFYLKDTVFLRMITGKLLLKRKK